MSIAYYNRFALNYIEDTKDLDMSLLYNFFERYLKPDDTVLDLGFGSGRDSLYFSRKYQVYSLDPVKEFVDNAKKLGLKNVYQMKAEDLSYDHLFEGIWACASLLHVSSKSLQDVFKKCSKALKPKGVMYVSFKYGNFEGFRNDRYFLDLNEDTIGEYLVETGLIINEISITNDVRAERHNEKWLNLILLKSDC